MSNKQSPVIVKCICNRDGHLEKENEKEFWVVCLYPRHEEGIGIGPRRKTPKGAIRAWDKHIQTCKNKEDKDDN